MVWPASYIYDDAGIILKYMDNFAEGCFFCYNIEDGPVFGVSGFIHGLLGGTLSRLHVCSPDTSLFVSNFIGLFGICFLALMILYKFNKNPWILYPSWLFIMLASPHVIITVKQGLETPLHIAILLIAFFLFLSRRTRLMCLFFTIAVISKLDALPIVGILALMYFAFMKTKKERISYLRSLLIYGGIPGLLWIAFTYLVFDGPLPQSAYAKLYHHEHPTGEFFPFFMMWFRSMKVAFFAFCILIILSVIYYVRKKQYEKLIDTTCFGAGALAYLGLYYYYNPVEKMSWYYAVFEILVMLQICVILLNASNHKSINIRNLFKTGKENENHTKPLILKKSSLVLGSLFILVAMYGLLYFNIIKIIDGTVYYLNMVESERVAVGKWINKHSDPDDVLLTSHGHMARYSGLYAIDFSGLNSKIVTEYKRDFDKIVKNLEPDWITNSGIIKPELQKSENYALQKSFYNISGKTWFPSFRIFKKIPEGEMLEVSHKIPQDMIQSNGDVSLVNGYLSINASVVLIKGFGAILGSETILLGLVKKGVPVNLTFHYANDKKEVLHSSTIEIPRIAPDDYINGYTTELRFSTDETAGIDTIIIEAREKQTGEKISLEFVDPVYQNNI